MSAPKSPDYDALRGDGPTALAPLATCRSGDSDVIFSAQGVRLAVHSGGLQRYSNAQLDDYRLLSRRAFPNRPPLTLVVRARFSHEPATGAPGIAGTAGFGFWNDPFAMSGARVPVPPRAVWFFYAGPPSNMKLDLSVPGYGWKAATIDTLRPAAIPPVLAAPVLVPLMRLSRAIYRHAWSRVQSSLRIAEALVPGPLTEWRDYCLEWGVERALFSVDGVPILNAPAPRGPLGFVIWCDNQYMIVTPQARFGHGYLSAAAQWLEFSHLRILPGQSSV